ncbi:hypothetical protein [Mucilaginibacter jinjuensis]|uniref:Uncharacterized protein n=1 Tax=Mucilaginibacter jinjuensis TaxID=1176721 RepID=A0ABY7T0G1_9SPHI|nr:hypothetical protein [Mucilaginibacter jinjuensis]WCT09914.1 hypothetical protein PQO05_14365 [Mucilaginibacter jinjuensis]
MKTLTKLLTAILLFSLCACKQPATDNELYNNKATVPAKFDIVKSGLSVLNTSFNPTKNTISILYGNKLAAERLRTADHQAKQGEELALVTWKRQADVHWFGANIPGELQSVEIVKLSGENLKPKIDYQKLLGPNLEQERDTTGQQSQANFILSQRASVMP